MQWTPRSMPNTDPRHVWRIEVTRAYTPMDEWHRVPTTTNRRGWTLERKPVVLSYSAPSL